MYPDDIFFSKKNCIKLRCSKAPLLKKTLNPFPEIIAPFFVLKSLNFSPNSQ